jgi:hypothetical protein
LALGGVLAAIAAGSWGIAAGSGSAGADVSALANLSGELDVTPHAENFLRGRALMPGDAASGDVKVRNQTPKPLMVRARLRADRRDLDRVLRASLQADGMYLYAGTLAGLRRYTRTELRLKAGETTTLRLRLSLPGGTKGGYEARSAEATLELDSRVAR